MMGSKAFESPLISHLRMRAIFRALVEVRLLGERLGVPGRVPRALEACWVSTAIDLRENDLTFDRQARQITGYIQSVGRRSTAGAPAAGRLREFFATETKSFPGSAMDHLFCSAGAAMAARAAGEKAVAVAYADPGQLPAGEWKRLLAIARDGELPLVIVLVPASVSSGPSALRPASGVPTIPVDACDAVAIYRVAQESTLRARAGGGTAVIDCVPSRLDPIKSMGAQLIRKQICTRRWVEAVEPQVRAVLARL